MSIPIIIACWVIAIFVFIRYSLIVVDDLDLFVATELVAKGGSVAGRSVAVVSMMRDPQEVDEWLNYHMLKGITRFYIRLESADHNDAVAKVLLTYPQVTIQFGSFNDTPATDLGDAPGHAQMLRQRTWLTESIKNALNDGIDWIVHIDSDELLECSGSVGDAIAQDARDKTQTMVIKNFEAVYPARKVDPSLPQSKFKSTHTDHRAGESCFSYNDVKDCAGGHCASYANGKSLGRVTRYLREAGVHRFHYAGPTADDPVEMTSMRLIHFESCDFNKYMDKFLKLSKSERVDFPFPYYNDSIAVAKSGPCTAPRNQQSCNDEFAKVYKRYRTDDLTLNPT